MKQFQRFCAACFSFALLIYSCCPGFVAAAESTESVLEVCESICCSDLPENIDSSAVVEEIEVCECDYRQNEVQDILPPTDETELPDLDTVETIFCEQPEDALNTEEVHINVHSDSFDEYAFFAENADHAQKIADSMGAYLISYQYGIGTLCLINTFAAHCQIASENEPSAVMLYPEYDYYVEETPTTEIPEDNSLDQWHHAVLNTDEAWKTASGDGVLVAVIDTGIDIDHEDLTGAIAAAETTIPSDYYGELCMFPEEYQGILDNLGHGTHIAGIISARKNQFGCTGVAPESRILSIKALERSGTQGRGKSSWVAAAVNMAVERGAHIINLSLGGTLVKDKLLMEAVENALDAGVSVVCAAGNTSSPVLMYPAAYNGTIAVSAVKPQGDSVTFASSYSNSGDWVDLTAPGSNILSTVPGGYEKKTGTSMACPMVSGALALLFSADNLLTADQAADILCQTALDLGELGKDDRYGYGIPDLMVMTERHQQMLLPDTPAAMIPSGSSLFRNTPVSLSTKTLHGSVVYTLDGSEPDESSAVWPEGGMVFPEDVSEVIITARTRCSNGSLGESMRYSYRFVPETVDITDDAGTIADVIPCYGTILDPILQAPCRRYRVTVAPDYELEFTLSAETAGVHMYLLDTEGSDANQLAHSGAGDSLHWKNDSATEKHVFLSLVLTEVSEISRDMPYSFSFSRQESAPLQIPEETEQKEEVTEETVPKVTAPQKKTESANSETVETQPAVYSDTEQTEEIIPPMVFQDFEEDWLYTMEEAKETTHPPEVEESAEEGGNTVMEYDYRFLLAGGVVSLFGIGLLLLGYFTGRKYWLIVRNGKPATATVLQITRCPDFHTFRYRMTYRTQNGQQITAYWNEHPRIRFMRRHPEGSTMAIKYLPDSPKHFIVAGSGITMISSSCCMVVGIGVILLAIRLVSFMFTMV